jgi:hypothetical protein
MERNDFWTTVIAAVLVFLAASPSLLPAGEGQTDNYGPLRWLLVAGPLAMVVLAVIGRRRPVEPSQKGESGEHDQ